MLPSEPAGSDPALAEELRDPTAGWIGSQNLIGLVRNTAPFLFQQPPAAMQANPGRPIDLAGHPLGFLHILWACDGRDLAVPVDGGAEAEVLADYFALCLACHYATVATFVPTDVDSKIRGLIWKRIRDLGVARRMFEFTLLAHRWDLSGVSRRTTALSGVGPVSGHDGEWLSVVCGALSTFVRLGDAEYAERAAAAIERELERQAHEFLHALERKGCEVDALRLTSSLTHNVGDLDQGISFWPKTEVYSGFRARFHRLAHENTKPFRGTYQRAARVYKVAMSPEGHRNYPLRGVKALRQSPELLLPLGPFLDDWGRLIATHRLLTADDRAEVLTALIAGCRKLLGQRGYFRAIHGFVEASGGKLDDLLRRLPSVAKSSWKDSQFRKEIAVPRVSFESEMKKKLSLAG